MPVPLNAFVDVVRVWLTEKLDYLINDSVPVKPSFKRGATPSDIDLICARTQKDHLFFLREEVYNAGKRIFATDNFQRVIVGPFLIPLRRARMPLSELLTRYEKLDIVIVEMKEIINDLFEFIHDAKEQKKKRISDNADKLRRTYALEMLHLVDTFMSVRPKDGS